MNKWVQNLKKVLLDEETCDSSNTFVSFDSTPNEDISENIDSGQDGEGTFVSFDSTPNEDISENILTGESQSAENNQETPQQTTDKTDKSLSPKQIIQIAQEKLGGKILKTPALTTDKTDKSPLSSVKANQDFGKTPTLTTDKTDKSHLSSVEANQDFEKTPTLTTDKSPAEDRGSLVLVTPESFPELFPHKKS